MPATTSVPAFAIVVMGVSGSGKSTVAQALAAHYGFALLDADDFHSVEAKAQMARGEPLTDAQREPWVDALGQALRQCVMRGESVVLAFSGLRKAHRQRLRASGVPMRFVYLHGTPAVIAARLGKRAGHFMPATLLDSQFEALQPPADEPDVVVVDIDAPLARVVAAAVAGLGDGASGVPL